LSSLKRLSSMAGVLAVGASAAVAAPPPAAVKTIDLSAPFAARSAWRFTATQGPEVDDPAGLPGDMAPGAILLCLRKDAGPCDPQLQSTLRAGAPVRETMSSPNPTI
jgi:hypothetical protein